MTDKGYVIRIHDLFDGTTDFRGMKEFFARTKPEIPLEYTYTLTGAKRALSNIRTRCFDPDRYQYSIERLDEFYMGRESVDQKTSVYDYKSSEDALSGAIKALQNIQNQITVMSDELDDDMLENVEGELDIVINHIGDVIEKHGWRVRCHHPESKG